MGQLGNENKTRVADIELILSALEWLDKQVIVGARRIM